MGGTWSVLFKRRFLDTYQSICPPISCVVNHFTPISGCNALTYSTVSKAEANQLTAFWDDRFPDMLSEPKAL